MGFPTICTLLPAQDEAVTLDAAIDCARKLQSHLDVVSLAAPAMDVGSFMPGLGAGVMAETIEQSRAQLRDSETMVKERLAREDIPWSSIAMLANADGIARTVKEACRFADLAVLARPDADIHAETLFDAILFDSALPILLCAGAEAPAFERITIAWDSSDQALAATRAALPLLRRARAVTILMVAPPPSSKGRFAPGECLAQFLSRHGIESDIDLLPRMRDRIADVLSQHVGDTRSDLLVMGAYGHSKLREKLLGGVTRDMIRKGDVPLFLAR